MIHFQKKEEKTIAKIGYIRVSSQTQETARQEKLMQDFAVDRIFLEKASGKNTERTEFRNMMSYIREGDVVYVESISRLSRSVRDLLKIIDEFSEKGVKFVSAKENIDTNTPQGRFTLNIFAALSELEREQTFLTREEAMLRQL